MPARTILALLLLAQPPLPEPAVSRSPAAPARAGNPDVAGFLSASALYQKCSGSSVHGQEYCYAYLAAVSDAGRAYQVWTNLRHLCLPAGTTQGELKDIFTDFLVQHPSRLRDQAASVIVVALQKKYPCG